MNTPLVHVSQLVTLVHVTVTSVAVLFNRNQPTVCTVILRETDIFRRLIVMWNRSMFGSPSIAVGLKQ